MMTQSVTHPIFFESLLVAFVKTREIWSTDRVGMPKT